MTTNMKKLRHIDTLPNLSNPRPVKMEVMCLGLSRTGTMSLHAALEILGYRPYHFKEQFFSVGKLDNHMQAWEEGLRAKLDGEGRPFEKVELDKVLGYFSAITDAPAVCFSDELVQAYPDAKVVLNVRDPDKWVKSMQASYYEIDSWKTWRIICYLSKTLAAELRLLHLILRLWTSNDMYNLSALRAGFLAHNAHIRDIVPKENLLEFRVEQGWEPLCKLLGKKVPDVPFPRVNEGTNTADLHWNLGKMFAAISIAKMMAVPVMIGGLAWGWKWFQGRSFVTS